MEVVDSDRAERGATACAVALTPLSWMAEADLAFSEWVRHGRRLGVMGRGAGWWIGDWLRYGNRRYGDGYTRAAKVTGYDPQTLMNMAYVASRFEISRRRETLSWSHHAEVAALGPEAQEQWLDRAERERLSVRDLRDLVRWERRQAEAEEESSALALAGDAQGDEVRCPGCGLTFDLHAAEQIAAAG